MMPTCRPPTPHPPALYPPAAHLPADDMTGASGPDISNLTLMHDAEQMESCGYADMTAIVNSLVKWAYKGDCGVAAFTVARACIGKPGVADGCETCRGLARYLLGCSHTPLGNAAALPTPALHVMSPPARLPAGPQTGAPACSSGPMPPPPPRSASRCASSCAASRTRSQSVSRRRQ